MRKKKNVAGAVKAFFRDLLLWLVRPKEFADAINEAEDEKDLDDRLRALYAGKTLNQLKHDEAIAGALAMKEYCAHRMKLAENMMLRAGADVPACEECPLRIYCLNEVCSWGEGEPEKGAGGNG